MTEPHRIIRWFRIFNLTEFPFTACNVINNLYLSIITDIKSDLTVTIYSYFVSESFKKYIVNKNHLKHVVRTTSFE